MAVYSRLRGRSRIVGPKYLFTDLHGGCHIRLFSESSRRKWMKGICKIGDEIGLSLRFGKNRGCIYAALLTIDPFTIFRSNCQATNMANVYVHPFLHLNPCRIIAHVFLDAPLV